MNTYDPRELSVVFGVAGPLDGWVEDSFLTITPDDDDFALVIGADGEGGRSASANKGATFKFEVLQTSATNDRLSAIRALGSSGVQPLLIRDNLGRTLVSASQAWIQRMPDQDFGKEVKGRAWTIRTDRAELNFVGGNA